MLYTDPLAPGLDAMARRLLNPYPTGLRVPGAEVVVANPAFATPEVQAIFTSGHITRDGGEVVAPRSIRRRTCAPTLADGPPIGDAGAPHGGGSRGLGRH